MITEQAKSIAQQLAFNIEYQSGSNADIHLRDLVMSLNGNTSLIEQMPHNVLPHNVLPIYLLALMIRES